MDIDALCMADPLAEQVAPYRLDPTLGHGRNLKRYGCQEHTPPLAPQGGHERAVVKLANDAWADLVASEPPV